MNKMETQTHTHMHTRMCTHAVGRNSSQTYTSFCKPPMYNFKMYQEVTINGFIVQAPGCIMRGVSDADGTWVVLWTQSYIFA